MRERAIVAAAVAVAAVAAMPAAAATGPKPGVYVDIPKQVYVEIAADGRSVTLLGGSCLAKRGGKLVIQRNGQWPVRLRLRADHGLRFEGTTSLGSVDLSARFANGRFTGSLKVAGCETAPFQARFHGSGG